MPPALESARNIRRHPTVFLLVVMAALVGTLLTAGSASPGSVLDDAACRWRVERQTEPEHPVRALEVLGPRNVWLGVDGSRESATLEHWDGTRWQRFRLPAEFGSWIYDLEALSTGEVWAVGDSSARWRDGRSELFKTAGGDGHNITGLSASGPNDIWGAGDRVSGYAGHPLIEHWDGRRWSVSFTESAYGYISDVLAFSARDVWAVGHRRVSPVGSWKLTQPVTPRWDGTRWRLVRAPAFLSALSGSPTNLWATAEVRSGRYAFARWDGRRWRLVLGPKWKRERGDSRKPGMWDLEVISPTNIVAVGNGARGSGTILRWNGQKWSREKAPLVYAWVSVDAVAGEIWAIGEDGRGGSVVARCGR